MVTISRALLAILCAASLNAQCSNRQSPLTTTQMAVCLEELIRTKADRTAVAGKADQSVLNGLATVVTANRATLNEKADKSEVANKADRVELDKKADKSGLLDQTFSTNRFWVLLAAVLVFFMQAGFKCLEVGMVGPASSTTQGAMKLFSWILPCALYVPIGFGLMFGTTQWLGGALGGNLFFPTTSDIEKVNRSFGLEFVLFQLGFAGTAVSIVAGAIAERTRVASFLIVASIMTVAVYPIFGHWAWGGSILTDPGPDQQGWLQRRLFLDFAGSTVVHSVGGWFALVAIWVVGPRSGRFIGRWHWPQQKDYLVLLGWPRTDRFTRYVNRKSFPSYNLGYAILGVFMLWFGWWGFNGGSHLKYDTTIADTILNTNLAGAFAGLSAYMLALWRDPDNVYEKLIGGALGGLVAITASCNIVTPLSACLIGLLAGVVHNFAFDLLLLLRIDDAVGAIPVHAFCGVLGTLCVAIFKDRNRLMAANIPDLPFAHQLAIQALGVCVAFAFTVIVAGVLLKSFDAIWPMRQQALLSPEDVTVLPAER